MQKRIRSGSSGNNKAYRVQESRTKIDVNDVIKQNHESAYRSMIKDTRVSMREKESVIHKTTIQDAKRTAAKVVRENGRLGEYTVEKTQQARPGSINFEKENQQSTKRGIDSHRSSVKNKGIIEDVNGKGSGVFAATEASTSRAAVSVSHSSRKNPNSTSTAYRGAYKFKAWNPLESDKKTATGENNYTRGRIRSTAQSSSKILKSANIATNIPRELRRAYENNDDDIGGQAYTKMQGELSRGTSEIIRKARARAVRSAQASQAKGRVKSGAAAVKKISKRQKNAKRVQKAGASIKKTAVAMKKAATKIATVAKNPIFLKALAIVVAVILLIGVVVVVGGALVSSTQSAKTLIEPELYEAIKAYSREKDKALQKKFSDYEKQPQYSDIAEEDVEKKMVGSCSTNTTVLTSYLLAKYDNSLTLAVAKNEIDSLHPKLYQLSATEGENTSEREEPVLDKNGKPKKDKDGKPITEKVTESRRTLKVTLTCTALKDYLVQNPSLFPSAESQEFYEHLLFTATLWKGGETGWGMPFEDDFLNSNITCQFGGPDAVGKPHRGTDFAAPGGTEILAVLEGTVIEAGYHYSWGNTVLTESEDGEYRIRYAHMVSFDVGVGDTLGTGDVVGYVGTTGFSTGNHLHLEVEENGTLVNSLDYIGSGEN